MIIQEKNVRDDACCGKGVVFIERVGQLSEILSSTFPYERVLDRLEIIV